MADGWWLCSEPSVKGAHAPEPPKGLIAVRPDWWGMLAAVHFIWKSA
jgi:hypothetical protein